MSAADVEGAILEALAYSDIFEYPLRLEQLHRYLPLRADAGQLSAALKSMRGQTEEVDGYYFLAGREGIVSIRMQREARSRSLLPRAMRYGCALGALPFVRMVALTGSLAVMNVSGDSDFDYMLVAARDRVWTARAFALAFNRLTRLQGYTLCPNLIVSEAALEWHLHDLYSARELCQMIPITGMDVYRKLMKANEWMGDYLPNALVESNDLPPGNSRGFVPVFRRVLEFPLRGKPGDRFEGWEMKRKVARFSKQDGFGEETVFTAEVCQGNFQHHRKWTREAFEERVNRIGTPALAPGASVANPGRSGRVKQSPTYDGIASPPIGSLQ